MSADTLPPSAPNADANAIGTVPNPELVVLKQRRARLLAAKVEALKRDALPFYRPHPKQDKFHRSTAKRRGVFTGNRFGKSHMGMAEDGAFLRRERPWYPKDDPARTSGIPQHPVKGLVIANDWDKVQEIFTAPDGKLWKVLPSDGFIKSTARNHSGAIDTVICANGSTLRFDTVKSFMSNAQGAESSDWDFVHVDEPIPEQMWKAVSRGLVDRNGAAWFTLTALREPWITDAFDTDGSFAGMSFVVEGSIYDNPTLTRDAIAAYEASLTDDEKECRIYGKPLHKAGLVYKEFQQDVHVLTDLPRGWRSWAEPPIHWSYYAYIDPHPHLPHMVLFAVVDPFNRLYFFHDIFDKVLIRELCTNIRTFMGERRFVRLRCDPLAYTEDPVNGTNMASEFWRYGLLVEKASKDLSRGILRVKESLRSANHPWFTPTCRRTLWEIKRYHWDEETNKPVDKDDHAMECLYRAILDDPRYIDPADLTTTVKDIEIPGTPDLSDLESTSLSSGNLREYSYTRRDLMLGF